MELYMTCRIMTCNVLIFMCKAILLFYGVQFYIRISLSNAYEKITLNSDSVFIIDTIF